ncbi:hypothetical protein LINPERPRIM_LOCUS40479 [Linum perenne]
MISTGAELLHPTKIFLPLLVKKIRDRIPKLAPFDPTKKKKKKKVVIQDIVEESVDKLTEKTESLSVADGAESSFLGLKKKKKKPVETKLLNEEIGDGEEEAALKRLNSTTIRIHRFDGDTKFAPPIKE